MQMLRTSILAAVAAFAIPQAPSSSGAVLVTAVFDGDTIDVASVGHVRLLGIDAPEISHGFDTAAPFSNEARLRLSALVLRRYIRLEYEGPREDMYGRRLAYVLLDDGTLINGVLLSEGLARVSARLPLRRLDELKRAEAEAQTWHRGMWGSASPSVSDATYGTKATKAQKAPKATNVPKATKEPTATKTTKAKTTKTKTTTKKTKTPTATKKSDGGLIPLEAR
jgi:endonuclease YncB( thermonuclease family)